MDASNERTVSSAARVRRWRLPRRRWIVESRPNRQFDPFRLAGWKRSLGPYFREATARDMMKRAKWFAPGSIVEWRVRRGR